MFSNPQTFQDAPGTPDMSHQPATVLVVDDEESLRRVVARALAGAGFRVLEAGHGAAGLEQLATANGEVHLVISDINMPVMDGLAFARELHGRLPAVPVLFMTGRDTALGAEEVLRKPFAPEQLLTAVARMLGATPPSATAPAARHRARSSDRPACR
jgi:two-component system, chemotaxis family, chemotaxis protein CheY